MSDNPFANMTPDSAVQLLATLLHQLANQRTIDEKEWKTVLAFFYRDEQLAAQLPPLLREMDSPEQLLRFFASGGQGDEDPHRFIDGQLQPLREMVAKQAAQQDAASSEPATPPAGEPRFWWINANPSKWKITDHSVGEEIAYSLYTGKGTKRKIFAYFRQIKPGDLAIGYQTTPVRKAVAILEFTRPVYTDPGDSQEKVAFRIKSFLDRPVARTEILSHPDLQECEVATKNPTGSLYKLTREEFEAIIALSKLPEPSIFKSAPPRPPITKVSIEQKQEDLDLDDLIVQAAPEPDIEISVSEDVTTRAAPELSDEAEPTVGAEAKEREAEEDVLEEARDLLKGEYAPFSIEEAIEPAIGVDTLSREIAAILANLHTGDKGKMVGIFGRWGRGKTFLMEQVCHLLNTEPGYKKRFEIVFFHAWKYQDTPASWAYLYEALAKRYYTAADRPAFKKPVYQYLRLFKLNLRRIGYWPLISFGLLLLAYIVFGDKIKGELSIAPFSLPGLGLDGLVGLSLLGLVKRVYGQFKGKAVNLFNTYFKKQSYKDLMGVQAEIQNELRCLLTAWISDEDLEKYDRRILLVVDDIDRCSEQRIIQIIDSLRVMLEDDEISKRVVILAAVDERVLQRAIQWKYHKLLETDYALKEDNPEKLRISNMLTREYMDKLFISGLKLGILTREEREEIFRALTAGKAPQEPPEAEEAVDSTIKEPSHGPSEPAGEKMPERVDGASSPLPTIEDDGEDDEEAGEPEEAHIDAGVAPDEPEPPAPPDYEISRDEYRELQQLIRRYQDATPRQIRIFYYRYLLARNLLDQRLKSRGIPRPEPVRERTSLLGELLLKYSGDHTPADIRSTKRELLRTSEPICTVFLPDGEKYEGDRRQILEILSILEMVIAY